MRSDKNSLAEYQNSNHQKEGGSWHCRLNGIAFDVGQILSLNNIQGIKAVYLNTIKFF